MAANAKTVRHLAHAAGASHLNGERSTDETRQLLADWNQEIVARGVHDRWRLVDAALDGLALMHDGRRLRVMASIAIEDDGRPWMHVSVSKPNGCTPTHDEMGYVKAEIAGPDRYAYAVHPPEDRHVNLSEVLHLWVPMFDHAPLPEFSHVVDGVRTI